MKMGEHEGRPWEHWLVSNINNTTSSKEKKKILRQMGLKKIGLHMLSVL